MDDVKLDILAARTVDRDFVHICKAEFEARGPFRFIVEVEARGSFRFIYSSKLKPEGHFV